MLLAVTCYGSTLQLTVSDPLYDLAALRAQSVCSEYFDQGNPEQFSPLKDDYVSAASQANFQIPSFKPHENDCDGCGN